MFQVSYVSVSTRETYSKVGRELLASIATVHPYIISVLLERLRETIKTVGMVGFIIPLKLNLHVYKVIVNGEYGFFFKRYLNCKEMCTCVFGRWLCTYAKSFL